MSKAFLIKTEVDAVFQEKKLEFREPGFSKDLEKFYVGGITGNIHIPSKTFVDKMIQDKRRNVRFIASKLGCYV